MWDNTIPGLNAMFLSYYCPECVEACLRLIEENNNDARRMFSSLAKVGRNN